MKLGLISDVHGNTVALEDCLVHLHSLGPDEIHFLGDAVGYLPDGAACVERLAAEGIVCQKGNHEAMLLGEIPVPEPSKAAYRLWDSEEGPAAATRTTISEWPERRELELGGRRILLVHGSPAEPLTGYVYPDSDLAPHAIPDHDLIVTANTHRPFVARQDGRLIANCGSVGLPRDSGSLASFAVYDTDEDEVTVYRVPFDADRVRELAAGRMHESVDAMLDRTDPDPFGQLLR